MVLCKAVVLTTAVCISIAIRATRVKRHEVRADVKQLSEAPIALRMTPGPLGIRIDAATGKVVTVYDGQSRDAGVTVGMIISKLDGADYTTNLLLEKKEGVEEYTVVLERPREQPLSSESLGTAKAALHYEEEHPLIKDIVGAATTALYAEQHLNDELSRTALPKINTHHEELSFDELVADDIFALDSDPPASRDNQHTRGPHKRLTQDSPMAKHSEWSADEGEYLKSGKWSAHEDEHTTKLVDEQGNQSSEGQRDWEAIAKMLVQGSHLAPMPKRQRNYMSLGFGLQPDATSLP